jgi:hypothetical protein
MRSAGRPVSGAAAEEEGRPASGSHVGPANLPGVTLPRRLGRALKVIVMKPLVAA